MSKIKVTWCVVLSLYFFGLLILTCGLIEVWDLGHSKNEKSTAKRESDLLQISSLPPPKGDKDGKISDPGSITSCSVAMEILPSPRSSKQWIYPHGNGNRTKNVEVLCDFQVDGGGWTVIQTRSFGPRAEFSQNWDEYVRGFGSLDRNFWLGLENIRALTKNGDQELRIQLEDFQGKKAYAKYSSFSISDASDFYRLSISGFSGSSTAGDSMTNSRYGSDETNNEMRFSTKDKDNDLNRIRGCSEFWSGGGWWFNNCGVYCYLNGPYRAEGFHGDGFYWNSWKGYTSLAKTEMKIRTRK